MKLQIGTLHDGLLEWRWFIDLLKLETGGDKAVQICRYRPMVLYDAIYKPDCAAWPLFLVVIDRPMSRLPGFICVPFLRCQSGAHWVLNGKQQSTADPHAVRHARHCSRVIRYVVQRE